METYRFWVQLNPVPEAVVIVGSGASDEVVGGTAMEDDGGHCR